MGNAGGWRRPAGLVLVALGLLTSGVGAITPLARADEASATVVPVNEGNPSCGQLAGTYGDNQPWVEIKVEPLATGTYGPDGEITVTASGNSFSWTSTIPLDAVFVKAGSNKHNLYLYDPPGPEAVHDEGLVPQSGRGNGISHISFCYDLDYGSFAVTKLVSDALGGDATFQFVAACDGHDAVTFELGHGEVWDSGPLLVGTECTITETLDELAVPPWTTTHQVDDGEETAGDETILTVTEEGRRVTFRNTRIDESEAETGRLVVTKTVIDGAGDGSQVFAFGAACGYPTEEGWTVVLLEEFGLGDGGSWVAPPIAVGAVCYVGEDVPEGWSASYAVDGGDDLPGSGTYLVVHEELNAVDFTNTREAEEGRLLVTKIVADDVPGEDTFEFQVSCDGEALEPFSLGHEDSWADSFPAGTECIVEELDPDLEDAVPPWETTYEIDSDGDEHEGRVAGVVIPAGDAAEIVFRNTRRVVSQEPGTARLVVTKTVVDDLGDGGDVFDFHLVCDDETDLAFELGDGHTWPSVDENDAINEFPVGTTCTVTEAADPDWDTSVTVDGGDPEAGRVAVVVIGDGGDTVAFTNVRRSGGGSRQDVPTVATGPLVVNKAVAGVPEGDLPGYTFDFSVDCTGDHFDGALQITGAGSTVFHAALPAGTTCTVTEAPVAAADGESWDTVVTDSDGDPDGTVAIVEGTGGTVAFTNSRTIVAGAQAVNTPPAAIFTQEPTPVVDATTLPRTGGDVRWLLVAAGAALAGGGVLVGWAQFTPLAVRAPGWRERRR